MAALPSRTCPTSFGQGVTGSSQGPRYFTVPIRPRLFEKCGRRRKTPQQSRFNKVHMIIFRNRIHMIVAIAAIVGLLCSCGLKRKKYENPIVKDTQQPDKVLFDKAISDIEHGRYEVARLTLNTLINTYDTSEFLAKAKLAVADSWYREGGSHAWAQAEA